MKQPERWRDTIDPFGIQFNNFQLVDVLGYPHARNDVFYCKGICAGKEVLCFVKHARQKDSDIAREIAVMQSLDYTFVPHVLDFDTNGTFIVTEEVVGERLSYILANTTERSVDYMFEYGKTLAQIHSSNIDCPKVAHRKFFDLPTTEQLARYDIEFAMEYLKSNAPKVVCECFCHGDFHYANVLWQNKKVSAVLDWELAGVGNRDFDIAWAIINRPGQQFLKTDKEVTEFLKGYQSVNTCNADAVRYYMVQIYCHFIDVGNNDEYKAFVKKWLTEHTK